MIKAILFDLDGIVLIGREKYFSERYAEEHDVPIELVSNFFLGQFKNCSFGQCDLKEELAPHLPKWKWPGTVDEFVRHWFTTESTVDKRVIAIIDSLRNKGIKCYIATRQEKYRMQYLLEEAKLKDHFDGTFVTCEIGCDKSDPAFFIRALETLKLAPEEVLFFDDKQVNVDTARSLGVDAELYTDISVLSKRVESLILPA